jgi:hypothetical protein
MDHKMEASCGGGLEHLHLNPASMYNRPNGQTSMAAVQGPNRHLGT